MIRLPVAPRPIKNELLSSWIARVAAVNGIGVSELIKYVAPESKQAVIDNLDFNAPSTLLRELEEACRLSPRVLSAQDLHVAMPLAATSDLLLNSLHLDERPSRRSMLTPSCSACLQAYERHGVSPPYWKAEWALALLPRCPIHLSLLSSHCTHCFKGSLAILPDPTGKSTIVRCAQCSQAVHAPSVAIELRHRRSRARLVASMELALLSAYRGADPDPRWVGSVDAETFLTVVQDLLWILLDGNFHAGYPLIGNIAPARDSEVDALDRRLWYRPLGQLSPRHRDIVVASLAVALLGQRARTSEPLCDWLPAIIGDLDTYPVSQACRFGSNIRISEMRERIEGWPAAIRCRVIGLLPEPPRVALPSQLIN